jgi:Chaperone of endosialidase
VRLKEAIKPTDQASEAILALKPVTFPYKRGLDPEGIPHFGFAPVCSAQQLSGAS